MDQRIVFYTTGCSKCGILKKKMDQAGIVYVENGDVDEMQALGMTEAPALLIGNELLPFPEAVKWVNSQKE